MGGGRFYNQNAINMQEDIPLMEQHEREEPQNRRSMYNPFLSHQPSWSSQSTTTNTVATVYPTYNPNEYHIDPVPLVVPELPPRPAAYRLSLISEQPATPIMTSSSQRPLNIQPSSPIVNTSRHELPPRSASYRASRIIDQPPTPIVNRARRELPPKPASYISSHITEPAVDTTNSVRLIYTKSGFYRKSTNPMEDNSIHGFLSIFSKSMDNVDILIAWIPEYLIEAKDIHKFIDLDGVLASDDGFPSIVLNLGEHETMTINLKNVHSLYVCPPIANVEGSIVITNKTGDIFKPLWYSVSEENQQSPLGSTAWPGFDIIDIISAFHPLQSSQDIPHVHFVEHTNARPLPIKPKREAAQSSITPTCSPISPSVMAAIAVTSQQKQELDPITRCLRDTRWSLLERLSRITQYSRNTAAQVLEPIRPLLPPCLRENCTVQTTVNEYQMASHYLARFGESSTRDEHYLADDVDSLLLGMPELRGPTPIHTRRTPISPEEWVLLFDHEGKLTVPIDQVRQLIFRGGLDADIRIEAWKFLLGFYPWDSTFNEREAIRRSRADAYYAIKAHWFDHPEIRNTKDFIDEKHRIDKDVHRTDRAQEAFVGEELPNPDPAMCVGTNANLEVMKDILVTYNFHNTELGYVQGMSDLLAPLFVAMGDEAMAFWGFSLFMERVQSNFYTDQSGMHAKLKTLDALIRFMDPVLYKRLEDTETSNLFFCFRWLLVWFKREFEWEDVIRLWEVLWTNYLSEEFILFVALAVIEQHRNTILEELNAFDEVLRYINDLTGNIQLETTLERAEVLFYQFECKVRAMQHKKSLLQEQLEIRSVWNSSERPKIQERIEKLEVPEGLLCLLQITT